MADTYCIDYDDYLADDNDDDEEDGNNGNSMSFLQWVKTSIET